MRKKFLQTSKLSLIIGLCLYGASSQPTMGAETTISLPPEAIWKTVNYTVKGKAHWTRPHNETAWRAIVEINLKVQDKENRWWTFEGQIIGPAHDEHSEPWHSPVTLPKNLGLSISYSVLYAEKVDFGAIWLLGTSTTFTVGDKDWVPYDGMKPQVWTKLGEYYYPAATTKVTVKNKTRSFDISTKD